MIPILFEQDATDFTSQGICALPDAISCVVTEERNGEYELEMEYPISGAHFSEISLYRIIVVIPFRNGTKQAFRIYRSESDLEGTVIFYAHHLSYDLNYMASTWIQFSGSNVVPSDVVNSVLVDYPQTLFEASTDGISPRDPFEWVWEYPTNIRAIIGGVENSMLDVFGGEMEWDNWDVIFHQHRGSDNGVRIAYGKNLTECSRALDNSNVLTGVMPYWAGTDEDGTPVLQYATPAPGHPFQHPHVVGTDERCMAVDFSADYETNPGGVELRNAGEAYLAKMAQETSELEISFVNIGDTEEYADIADLETVNLCDTVTVSYPALGIEVKAKVTRTQWDVLQGRYVEITIGGEASLSDTIFSLQAAAENGDLEKRVQGLEQLVNLRVQSLTIESVTVTGLSQSIPAGGSWQLSDVDDHKPGGFANALFVGILGDGVISSKGVGSPIVVNPSNSAVTVTQLTYRWLCWT